MSTAAIRVNTLSKRYTIGRQPRAESFREMMTQQLASPFRAFEVWRKGGRQKQETPFWALRDVSFEVKPGEIVGILGRNGAGKSTLLRVLSRITDPTEGSAELYGRVGSLLEVGTGFHSELTGRENIYLNGAILGMRKKEIDRKFDEIVSFAEVEKFIDAPVKKYSSGMHVRLAFAVAAHLNPEILLVDEVLAVGDASFQKKCLGKMGDVARGGQTVLFVSHQINQIRRLCDRSLWLERGKIQRMGDTAEVTSAYETSLSTFSLESSRGEEESEQHVPARFLKWEIVEPRSSQPHFLSAEGPVTLRFLIKINQSLPNASHGIILYNHQGDRLWGTGIYRLPFKPGIAQLMYQFPGLPLWPGTYFWRVSLYDNDHYGRTVDDWECSPPLVVTVQPEAYSKHKWEGLLRLPYKFSAENYQS